VRFSIIATQRLADGATGALIYDILACEASTA
jgi:hypothetical protein